MKNRFTFAVLAWLALTTFNSQCLAFSLVGTEFTYQGRLADGAGPANGTYDLLFTVYDSTNQPGIVISGPLTNAATVVSDGLFTVTLDFGTNVFNLSERWLEIGVRTNGAATFIALAPRHRFDPTPYAITAENAGNLLGTVSVSQLPSVVITNNQAGVSFGGSFSGNGSGLTNVNALTLGGVAANGFWRTTGNVSTTPGPNFIGTADNQPLEIQVNATRALRIEPHGISAPSLVGGYYQNTAAGVFGAAVAGGGAADSSNQATGDFAFVGAGYGNSAEFASAAVAGAYNGTPANYSFVGSGAVNTNGGDFSFLGGGELNLIGTNSPYATIGGGYNNGIQTNSQISTIEGGHDNAIQSANFAIIGGGGYNVIQSGAYDSVLGGGGYGTIQTNAHSSFIGGGGNNTIGINSAYSSVVGGEFNTNGASYAIIAGGNNNLIEPTADYSGIGGGVNNMIQTNANESTISGGHDNTIQAAAYATIGGGGLNVIQTNAYDSVIAGGGYGLIQNDSHSSVIGGGGANNIQTNSPYSFIGGGYFNIIQFNDFYTTIAGGGGNTIQTNSPYSTIGGGIVNTIETNSSYSTIGGGYAHVIQSNAPYATIPGGYLNTVAGAYGFAAGQRAQTLHQGAFVWADSQNAAFTSTTNDQFNVRAQGGLRFVTGGAGATLDGQPMLAMGSGISILQNTSGAPNIVEGAANNFIAPGVIGATISGGGVTNYQGAFSFSNSVTANFGTVNGGYGNAAGFAAEVVGGEFNTAGTGAFVGGGLSNNAIGFDSVIGGGQKNLVTMEAGIIVGGEGNTNTGVLATIGGGVLNRVSGVSATVSGGALNTSSGNYAFVGGGYGNTASGVGSFVGGGGFDGSTALANVATGAASFIGGGLGNSNGASYCTISGGSQNIVQSGSTYGVIAGGIFNTNNALGAVVGGGGNNNAIAQYSTVAGGFQNSATGPFAVLSGGYANSSSGSRATVPGGYLNSAAGDYSFAAGQQAQALHQGAFVWADSQNAAFASTVSNQFSVRADNGLRVSDGVNGNIVAQVLHGVGGDGYHALNFNGYFDQATSIEQRFNTAKTRWRLVVDQRSTSDYMSIDTAFNGSTVLTALTILTNGNVGIGIANPTNKLHVAGGVSATIFITTSDRNAKENFEPVSSTSVLDKVMALPITRWTFKEMPGQKHLGPMAQDFYAAFALGQDDKSIATVDEGGVALAAIQGLNEKVESENAALRTENAELKARLDKIEELLSSRGSTPQ